MMFLKHSSLKRSSLSVFLVGSILSLSSIALAQNAESSNEKISELEAQVRQLQAQNAELTNAVNALLEVTGLSPVESASATQIVDPRISEPVDDIIQLQNPTKSVLAEDFVATLTNQKISEIAKGSLTYALEGNSQAPIYVDDSSAPLSRNSATTFGLTAGKDSSRVSINVSKSKLASASIVDDCLLANVEDIEIDDPCNEVPIRYQQDVTSYTLSSPIDKSGETSFATLDGLSTGTKAEVRKSIFFGSVPSAKRISQSVVVKRAVEACLLVHTGNPDRCTNHDAAFIKAFMSAEDQEAYADLVFDETIKNSFGLTFAGALGYEEFSFIPTVAQKAQEVDYLSGSLSAGLLYFPARDSSLHFEGRFETSRDAATSATRCLAAPQEGETFLQCSTGAFAKPSLEEKLVFSQQYRKQFQISETGLIQSIAIAPKVELDVLSDDFAIDLPVFLVSNKDEGMVAGIRAGYVDKDDDGDVTLGVFYGKAFDFTPF